ncbi:MAG: 3'(2'),5'-bisphosphate nucleotidase CysQ [Dehalococcoidia bacterium]
MSEATEYQRELDIAVTAARQAGAEVARMRRDGLRYGHKEGRELVSEADIRAAEMLHEAITGAFPDDGWLSEEHVDTDARLGQRRTWIVDPIDGTREFLMGIPEYSVSVGLAVDGEAVLGVVFNPATEELFSALCNDVQERPAGLAPKRYRVLVGRGEQRWDDIPPLPSGAETAGVGSVAYRLALIAAGKGDVVVTGSGRSEWDVAAGVALCRAAGLRATGVLGDPLTFNQPEPWVRGLLVGPPVLHEQISTHFRAVIRRQGG